MDLVILYGFPQAFVLGSLHFNVFITDLFLVLRNIENYRHRTYIRRTHEGIKQKEKQL